VEHRRPHRRDALAALLWPDQPADRARQSLRQALLHVRQALCDTAASCPFLLVERNEVQLNPLADVRLDVADFTELVDACESHLHRSRSACLPCHHRYEAMLKLYRGEFLAGFLIADSEVFEEWALLNREWLHIRAMQSLTQLADYHERRGELNQARGYVQQQVRLEPWREEAHRQLMRLLALAGERSAALAQYEVCRRILRTEFGAEPAAETVQLWQRIHDSADTAPTPETLTHFSAAPFFGREAELAEIAELLAGRDCRLVTLTGPGGSGKTRLALQVAEEHRGLFADGVVAVNLSSVAQEETVALAIADALALAPALPGAPAWQDLGWLFRQLRNKELLLVLDNFEHLVECGLLLSDLLRHAPGVVLLVTSRERLRLQEEWVYVLDGLAYPASPAELDAPPLSYSALALFRQRAVQVQRHFTLTGDHLPDVTRICRLVEGLPLGIELAAAATGERSCAEIASALEQTLDALETSLRNVPPRHRSLRAAFEHSWAFLTPSEQQHFIALAVFQVGFDAEAAHAIAGVTGADLARLTAKSLLTFDGARYMWHQATHQYAVERLEADLCSATALRRRHCTFFATRVLRSAAALDGAHAHDAITLLERERANLRLAWQWAVSWQQIENLATMLEGIGKFYRLRGPAQEGLEMIIQALVPLTEAAEPPALSLLAQLWAEQAQLLNLLLRYEEALDSTTHLIQLGERSGAPIQESMGYFLRGQTLQQQGKYEAAQQALEHGLHRLQTMNSHSASDGKVAVLQANLLRELGNIAVRRGEQATAHQLYEDALGLYQAAEDRRGECAILNNLGIVAYERGDYGAARARLTEALALYRSLGNLPGEAKALNNLANVAADQRDYGAALQHYQAALELHRATDNAHAQSSVINNLGALFWDLGLYAEARDAYQQALSIYRESGNRQAEGETLANLSLLELRTGSPSAALPLAVAAAAASIECDDPSNRANAYTYRGQIHATLAEWDEAECWYRQALAIRQEVLHPGRLLELVAELAYLTWQRGQPAQALSELATVLAALQDAAFLEGAEDPYQVYWICYEILRANADVRAASCLTTARQRLLAQADRIPDPLLRRSFLENVPSHRRIANL
jgi:predicted ATPase/DNA-binding SARP family transcriptional activator/Tfp pilus assembly protein PilF